MKNTEIFSNAFIKAEILFIGSLIFFGCSKSIKQQQVSSNTYVTSSFATALNYPNNIAIDKNDNLYISNGLSGVIPIGSGSVLMINSIGSINTIGNQFSDPAGMVVDGNNNLFVVNNRNNINGIINSNGSINKISNGNITTFASGLGNPVGIAIDSKDNLFVTDAESGKIYKISATGQVAIYASGFNDPTGIAVDANENLYISEANTGEVFKVSNTGVTSTIAGLAEIFSICVDGNGNSFVPCSSGIAKISSTGLLTYIAGITGAGITIDKNGNLYLTNPGIPNNNDGFITKITSQ